MTIRDILEMMVKDPDVNLDSEILVRQGDYCPKVVALKYGVLGSKEGIRAVLVIRIGDE